MEQEDCVSDAVNETLTVGELVYDALEQKLEDRVGERDCDADGVKEDDKVALRESEGEEVELDENVALRDIVNDTVAESVSTGIEILALSVGELVYDALAQKLEDSEGERDCDADGVKEDE